MAFVASMSAEDVEDDNSPVKIKMMTSKPEVYKGEVITVQCLVTNHEPDWDEITVEINRSVFNRYSVSTLVMPFLGPHSPPISHIRTSYLEVLFNVQIIGMTPLGPKTDKKFSHSLNKKLISRNYSL